MDDIVRQAMAKWPNVPHCYGWLGLDARGNWYMRDDRAQAQGRFGSGNPGAKGSMLKHEKLIEFIQRNYASDASGQWYFQNGPQRVYVELESAPWVWRLDDAYDITAHTGQVAQFRSALVDELGWLYLQTDLGFGLVHTQDVHQAAEAMDVQKWSVGSVIRSQIPDLYGFVVSPESLQIKRL
jgi:hypothetical protein